MTFPLGCIVYPWAQVGRSELSPEEELQWGWILIFLPGDLPPVTIGQARKSV